MVIYLSLTFYCSKFFCLPWRAIHLTLQMQWIASLINRKKEFYELTNKRMLQSICSIKWIAPTALTGRFGARFGASFRHGSNPVRLSLPSKVAGIETLKPRERTCGFYEQKPLISRTCRENNWFLGSTLKPVEFVPRHEKHRSLQIRRAYEIFIHSNYLKIETYICTFW